MPSWKPDVYHMVILLVITYNKLGWLHSLAELTAMAAQVPQGLMAKGHQGWTAMPRFGSPLWWQMVSTHILGVGIGVRPNLSWLSAT